MSSTDTAAWEQIQKDLEGGDLDAPVWGVRIVRDGEEQMYLGQTFYAMMALLITPLGPVLNRPEIKFEFEIYRDGELRCKLETFPVGGKPQ